MAKSASLESDANTARATLTDALKGIEAADASLGDHAKGPTRRSAINLPAEEALVAETVRLMERWKTQAASLLRLLDDRTSASSLAFAGLFDASADQQRAGYFQRKFRMTRPHPDLIASDLKDQLTAAAVVAEALSTARPDLAGRFLSCEAHLMRLVEQRQRVDFDIEDIQRQSDVLMLQIADRRSSASRDTEDGHDLEAEQQTMVLDRKALQARELALKPERATLTDLAGIYEGFVETLNAQVGIASAMAGKLAVDNEQRIALLKAVEEQLGASEIRTHPRVAALVTAFDANVLAGHDLGDRKANADRIYARRLETRSPAAPNEAEAEVAIDAAPNA